MENLGDDLAKKAVWLLLIAPGLVSIFLASSIYDFGEIDEFRTASYALTLTFVNLIVAYVFFLLVRQIFPSSIRGMIFAVITLLVSLFVGVFIGISAEKDYLYRALRAAPWTDHLAQRSNMRPLDFLLSQNSTGQMAVEGDGRPRQFKATEAWLRVELEGRIYEGWPEFWGSDESQVYLSPACRILDSGVAQVIPGPGVVVAENKILTAVFLDRLQSPCFVAWEEFKNTTSGARNPSNP